MTTYNILPEYCQHGYLVGAITSFLSSRQPTLVNWFMTAYSNHCARFLPYVHPELQMVNSLWGYVLAMLSTKSKIDMITIVSAFNFPEEKVGDLWMATFEKYIYPILENNIEHILEVI